MIPGSRPITTSGRYSDAYKTPENYAAWEKALDDFDAGDFPASCLGLPNLPARTSGKTT